MTTPIEADPDTALFTALVDASLMDDETGPWASDTKLEVLAWELATYMPDLARDLAAAGRSRISAI